MVARLLLFVSLVGIWLGGAAASENDAASFLGQVDAVVEDTIPPITQVLPDYPAAPKSIGVVVADFQSRGDATADWGKAVGQILHWELLYGNGSILRVPDFNSYYDDAAGPGIVPGDIGRSAPSATLAAKRLGIGNLLTGTIAVTDGKFDLEVALNKVDPAETIERFRLAGPLDDLPAALAETLRRTTAALGVPPIRHDMEFTPQTLRRVAEALAGDNTERRAKMRALWLDGVATPLTAAYYLANLDAGKDLDKYFENLEQVHEIFPGEPGIEFAVARYIGYRDRPMLFDKKVARLKKIVVERPQDPTPMLVLCDALGDTGYTLDALAVCRAALLRFPDSYRAWWSMGTALMHHAWMLRGTGYWNEVSAKGQRQFPVLKDFGGRAVSKALAINDYNSRLWSTRMWTIGDYSPEFLEAFENSTRLDPNNRNAYELAIIYTAPQWGGSFDAQDEALDRAREHITDEGWREYVEHMFVGERPFWQRAKHGIKIGINMLSRPVNAVLAVLLLAAVAIAAARLRPQKKRGTTETER